MKRKILVIITFIIAAHVALITGLLIIFFNSNYYYQRKLVKAIYEKDIVEVQRIIEKKPSCINTYPTVTSSRLLDILVEERARYPLNQACGGRNIEIIELLIDNGADVNCNDGLTPLSVAYSIKAPTWYEVSQILIEHGASLDYTTEYSGGKSAILMDIVDRGYGVYLPGYRPESKEEEERVIESFNYALENCDHSKVDWMWVLKCSVSNDRLEIVKILLDQKYCDVNDTSGGMTALMFAAKNSTLEMVQLLLDYGADKSIKYDEKTAYDYAVHYNKDQPNKEEIIALLEY